MTGKARVAQLDPRELQEFQLRQLALQTARNQYLLVEEAYQAWVQRMGKKYRFAGRFDIDLQTGALTPRPELRTNGHGPAAEIPDA